MNKVLESAVMLGPEKALVGIITQPVRAAGQGVESSSKPVVVILNSGIMHRVGANRMSVLLARALAQRGHLVLRFDLAGLGDSETRKQPLAPMDSVMADLRDVLDSLQATRQVDKVVLMGLCSGANHSVGYAHLDPRVAGVVLIDPSIPRTRGYFMRHSLKRARDPKAWANLLMAGRQKWRLLRESRSSHPSAAADTSAPAERPARMTADAPQAREWLEAAYSKTVASGVQMLAVFTGGLPGRLNYPEQLLEAFPAVSFGSQLRLEYRDASDHEFTLEHDRAWLFDTVLDWTDKTVFSRGASST